MAFSFDKQCRLTSCERRKAARGLCKSHYQRLMRCGDVMEGVAFGQITPGRPKGFKHSAETKQKIIAAKTGMHYTRHKSTFKKPNGSGEKHWNWRGGITSLDRLQRVKFWKGTRLQVLERDSYTCQVCQKRGGDMQVDHIKKWSDNPKLRFELSNLRTLCMACHYFVTFKRKIPSSVVWGRNLGRRIAS